MYAAGDARLKGGESTLETSIRLAALTSCLGRRSSVSQSWIYPFGIGDASAATPTFTASATASFFYA